MMFLLQVLHHAEHYRRLPVSTLCERGFVKLLFHTRHPYAECVFPPQTGWRQ